MPTTRERVGLRDARRAERLSTALASTGHLAAQLPRDPRELDEAGARVLAREHVEPVSGIEEAEGRRDGLPRPGRRDARVAAGPAGRRPHTDQLPVQVSGSEA